MDGNCLYDVLEDLTYVPGHLEARSKISDNLVNCYNLRTYT